MIDPGALGKTPAAALLPRWLHRPPQRVLALEAARNVRDVGGYLTLDDRRTRWGLLFRSGSLHNLPVRDQSTLLNCEIRTIIDLRQPEEAFDAPDDLAGSLLVRYYSVPLPRGADAARFGEVPASLLDFNRILLEHCRPQIKRVFDLLCEPGALPAVVHCSLGKDRTGLIVGLLLSALHVPARTIADDYGLSARFVASMLDDIRARARRSGSNLLWFESMLECRPETMLRTLDELQERYSTVSAYLRSIGILDEQLNRLCADLLEPAVPTPPRVPHGSIAVQDL